MLLLLDTLKKIIIDGYEEKIKAKGNAFTLSESGKQATCKEARFRRSFTNILVYKFDKVVKDEDGDKISDPFIFLKKGIARSKCDYLLFYPYEKEGVSKLFVFLCNLKSGNRSNNEDQLNSGKILGQFLAEHAIRCHNVEHQNTSGFIGFSEKDIKFIKILFSETKALKRTTKIENKKRKVPYIEFSCKSDICHLDKLCEDYWNN